MNKVRFLCFPKALAFRLNVCQTEIAQEMLARTGGSTAKELAPRLVAKTVKDSLGEEFGQISTEMFSVFVINNWDL